MHQLRIDLEDFENNKRWAKYAYFHVGDKSTNFKLSAGRYSGDAGDGLGEKSIPKSHNGYSFTTYDNDNDSLPEGNCAVRYACYISLFFIFSYFEISKIKKENMIIYTPYINNRDII